MLVYYKRRRYINHMFFGCNMSKTMLRIDAMNMMTYGIERPFIECCGSLPN